MRRMAWAAMDEADRAALCARGLADIFDPALRTSIAALIEDVRERGDAAVCDALPASTASTLEPDAAARRPPTRSPRPTVSPAVDAALDDAIAHCRAFNEQLLARARRLELRARAGAARRREGHADRVGRAVRAVRQGELPERRLPARRAGRRRRRAPRSSLVVPPVPGGGGAVDPAVLVVCRKLGITDVFRVNGPAGIAALGFGTESIPRVRKVVGPGSPAVTCAQVEMQRHGVATMMLLGPTESLVDRRRRRPTRSASPPTC